MQREGVRQKVWRAALTMGVISTPIVITLVLVAMSTGANLYDFVPTVFVDDLYYWQQINTFSTVDFDGGYYTADEKPADAPFIHYYTKGPWFPMIYGTVGRLVGWQAYSAPFFNMATLSLALAVFIYLLRPTNKQLIATGLVMTTAWPVLFFIVSNRQESINQAFTFVMAAVFYLAMTHGPQLSRRAKWVGLAYVFFMAVFRLTWALLLIPYLVYITPSRTRRGLIAALVKAVVAMALVLVLVNYFNAPYSFNIIKGLSRALSEGMQEGPLVALGAGLEWVIGNVGDNLAYFNQGTSLEISQRYQYLVLIAVTGGVLVVMWRRHRREGQPTVPLLYSDWLFYFGGLAYILIFHILLYEMAGYRDYRVMSAHLVLMALTAVAFSRFRLVALVIVLNLVFIIPFRDYYSQHGKFYFGYDKTQITAFAEVVNGYVVYNPDVADPWCNTLLLNYPSGWSPELMALHPGIGISKFMVTETLTTPLKSRYLLLNERNHAELAETMDMELLTRTTLGGLYLNLEASCD